MFDTGKKEWKQFAECTEKCSKTAFYLRENGQFSSESPSSASFTEYFSDPNKPVPSSTNLKEFNGFTPRNYMSEDQRFAENRIDVASLPQKSLQKTLLWLEKLK